MSNSAQGNALASANLIRRSLSMFARHMRALREDHGVSASKLSALGRLLRAERPMTASELAASEGLQPQSLTRIIADLEVLGLIERRQNADDRRQIDVSITDKGVDLLVRDARRQNEWLATAMTNSLTPAERAILALAAELLDRMVDRAAVGAAVLSSETPRSPH